MLRLCALEGSRAERFYSSRSRGSCALYVAKFLSTHVPKYDNVGGICPYHLLRLPRSATLSEIRVAYYRRARDWHPDLRRAIAVASNSPSPPTSQVDTRAFTGAGGGAGDGTAFEVPTAASSPPAAAVVAVGDDELQASESDPFMELSRAFEVLRDPLKRSALAEKEPKPFLGRRPELSRSGGGGGGSGGGGSDCSGSDRFPKAVSSSFAGPATTAAMVVVEQQQQQQQQGGGGGGGEAGRRVQQQKWLDERLGRRQDDERGSVSQPQREGSVRVGKRVVGAGAGREEAAALERAPRPRAGGDASPDAEAEGWEEAACTEVWRENMHEEWEVVAECYRDFMGDLSEEVSEVAAKVKADRSPRDGLDFLLRRPAIAVGVIVVPLPVLVVLRSPVLVVGFLRVGGALHSMGTGAASAVLNRLVMPVASQTVGRQVSGAGRTVLEALTEFSTRFLAAAFTRTFGVAPDPAAMVWAAFVETHAFQAARKAKKDTKPRAQS